MEDQKILAIRNKVFSELALANDNFESAQILFDAEKHRASIPLFRESLYSGLRALLTLSQDEVPQNSFLIQSFHQTEWNKRIKLDISLNEILQKLRIVEQDCLAHPLKIGKKSIKDLETCNRQIKEFLNQANQLIKKSLLTSKEIKRRKIIKRVSISVSAAIVMIFGIVKFISILDNGLYGSYYSGLNFEKLVKTKTDRKIDFNWGAGKIVDDYSNNVCIRWKGKIKIPEEGRCEFITRSDDGVRLWIDDKFIINDWKVHGIKSRRARLNLKRGYHKIKIEYFEHRGKASIKLMWKLPGFKKKEVIPPSKLKIEKNGNHP